MAPKISRLLSKARHTVLNVIDFFYTPFREFMDLRTFRYLVCGGSNQVIYLALFYVSYNYFFHGQPLDLPGFRMTAHIAAYIVAFSISFPVGFILSRHIVFPESNLHGAIQFIRYAVLIGVCILLTYIMLKFFVEWLHWNATLSAALTSAIIAVFSYFSQRNFTFQVKESHSGQAH